MASKIDHDRLDQILSCVPQLDCEWDAQAAEEFEAFRKLEKLSRPQRRRVQHLQRHLDAGEIVCDCYEEVRTDRLGREGG